jgi:hypothetical protein
MRNHIIAAALLSLAFVADTARASNLVPNPDFNEGLANWNTLGDGTVTLDLDAGLPTPPSLHIATGFSGLGGASSSCIQIDDSTNVDLHILVKGVGASGGLVSASVLAYSDTACTTFIYSVPTLDYPIGADGAWFAIGYEDTELPPGTASVQVVMGPQSGTSGATGDALFDHVAFGPTGTLDDALPIAQEGFTGAWYNPDTSGQGFEFVIDPGANGGRGSLFGAWYTYDATAGGTDTQRWYSLEATFQPDDTTAMITIYQNIGGNFDALPATTAAPVGSATLTFFSCELALFAYNFESGPSGATLIQNLLPNVQCDETGTPPPSDYGLSGAWYDSATSGQGILAAVNPVDAQVFVGWYTYGLDASGDDASGQRWLSLQGAYEVGTDAMDLTIYSSTNGTFDSGETAVTTTPVGFATLTFLTCTTATLDYAFTDGEFAGKVDSIDLVRLGAPLASCPLDP